jgi:hypothetical protein
MKNDNANREEAVKCWRGLEYRRGREAIANSMTGFFEFEKATCASTRSPFRYNAIPSVHSTRLVPYAHRAPNPFIHEWFFETAAAHRPDIYLRTLRACWSTRACKRG